MYATMYALLNVRQMRVIYPRSKSRCLLDVCL